jgi:hypothetical protein
MTTVTYRYTLEQVEDIIFNGFDYRIPDKVMDTISKIAQQVGSPDYVKTPVFKKRENPLKAEPEQADVTPQKKKKGNKGMEVTNDEDWDSIRSFQTTKLEAKTGIDAEFDLIRASINKMTDKNAADMKTKIIEIVDRLVTEHSDSNLSVIGTNIFDIASSNRYYSKIYAELYAELSKRFEFIKEKIEENFNKFADLFNIIEYVDPAENYDRFCEINKMNEKRKSLAMFYMNLMYASVIPKEKILTITRNLLSNIYEFISLENKKNEVEELTETIALMYKKDLYTDEENSYELINGLTINEVVEHIANSKVKDYKSLTNKSLFKFMDLIEM